MIEALSLDFFTTALLAGLLASIACGALGSLVVVNRLTMIVGGTAHAAYGGVGLAFFLGLSPLAGALAFTVPAAALMGWVSLRDRPRADAVIGVLWAVGMALGVILIDLTPGYNVDLMSYLFGSILAVAPLDLYLLAGLDAVILALIGWNYHHLEAMSFDPSFARSRGVAVDRLYLLLVVLTAVTVVLVIRVVGLLLVIALVTIPPYLAEGSRRSLKGMMVLAVLLSAGFTVIGLFLAYRFNLTSGPAIILVAGAAFLISLVFRRRKMVD